MAVELPDELIVQILSILPAESLLRCHAVCKSWLNLINSTEFKLMHLHNFNQLNPRYFVRGMGFLHGKKWFCVQLDDEAFTFDCNVQFPFRENLRFKIIGCCNGVVCVCDGSSDMVILWNPSIRRKLTLPLPIFKSTKKSSFVVLGFGYDKMTDDYKVVRQAYTNDPFDRPHVEVYAVKTGIWREVMFPDDLRCLYVNYNWTQVFSNGSLHWITSVPTPGVLLHNSILTFDISSELFGEIQLPDDLVKVELGTMMISIVGESLAVTYYNALTRMVSSTYKIWVMKEYKNPTSWTLIHNMHYPDIDMGKLLQVRNKGNMIMESRGGNIIVYNYSGHASCICPGYDSGSHYKAYVHKYQESLALLDVGHSVSVEEGD